jgi:ABC-type glutathione transport system ATPase component
LISHDIHVVEWMSDEIAFMEEGKIVDLRQAHSGF